MGVYSIWPFFVCMAGLLALASTPAFRSADTPPGAARGRNAGLDGLRGYLALAVFFNHAAISHEFLTRGAWHVPPSPFFAMLGEGGVAMFFMLTGHLFWSRMIRDRGRTDWAGLYVGRLFRIAPLYLLAILLLMGVVAVRTDFVLRTPLPELLKGCAAWLALGTMEGPDLNLYPNTFTIVAGVTWTLGYEWLFYVSLPVMALAAWRGGTHLPAAALLAAGALLRCRWHGVAFSDGAALPNIVLLFASGMLAASLGARGLRLRLSDRASSALALCAVAAAFLVFSNAYHPGAVLLLGLAFFLIASGSPVFGAVTCRPARRLGDVSYGIYLLQGIVLTLVLSIGPLRALALASPAGHWAAVSVCAVVLVGAAAAAHVAVELPGIALGRRVAARLGRAAPANAAVAEAAPVTTG